ncbi:MAG: RDD family protein [Alphaproteobacteria bacterium]|nr:RDD family protein [Alphaproteobacteria bacterium]
MVAFERLKLDPEKFVRFALLRPRKISEEEKRHGTFNRRMIAASLDSLLITALIAPLVDFIYIKIYGMPTISIQEIATRAGQETQSGDALRAFLNEMQSSGFFDRWADNLRWQMLVWGVYTVLCWHYWSATPGKMLCRLKVIDAKTGGPLRPGQGILRALGYFISAVPLGLGFFWIGIDRKRRGWHDLFAGTLVVKTTATSAPVSGLPSDSPAPSAAE